MNIIKQKLLEKVQQLGQNQDGTSNMTLLDEYVERMRVLKEEAGADIFKKDMFKRLVMADKNLKDELGAVYTNRSLVVEILNCFPDEVWLDPKCVWCDPACGSGNFLLEIQYRLRERLSDWAKEQWGDNYLYYLDKWIIEKMLIGCDISKRNIHLTKTELLSSCDNDLGNANFQLYCHDSLDRDFWNDKPINIVTMNPPFQALDPQGSRKSKANNLWSRFIRLFTTIVGEHPSLKSPHKFVASVNPGSWMSTASKKAGGDLRGEVFNTYDILHLEVGTGNKYFPTEGIGTVTWFVLSKTKTSGLETRVRTQFNNKVYPVFNVDLKKLKYLPTIFIPDVIRIVEKVMGRNENIPFEYTNELATSSKFNRENVLSSNQDKEHPYPIFHTNAQILYSTIPHSHQNDIKVMVSLSGKFEPFIDEKGVYGATHIGFYVLVPNVEMAKSIASVLNSKLYRFIVERVLKWSGFNSQTVIVNLPAVDFSHLWTDNELYELFNIDEDEIEFIETVMKKSGRNYTK